MMSLNGKRCTDATGRSGQYNNRQFAVIVTRGQPEAAKGVRKFIVRELPLDLVKAKYGAQYTAVTNDVKQHDDLRVLDYNGYNVFHNFSFSEMGEPYRYE
jgi:hypothetical protein